MATHAPHPETLPTVIAVASPHEGSLVHEVYWVWQFTLPNKTGTQYHYAIIEESKVMNDELRNGHPVLTRERAFETIWELKLSYDFGDPRQRPEHYLTHRPTRQEETKPCYSPF
jgi:hypothetical protein